LTILSRGRGVKNLRMRDEMNDAIKTVRGATPRWQLLLGALSSVVLSMLVGSAPARGAVSCETGEIVKLTNPAVTVIDGAGDERDAEQVRWSELEFSTLIGPMQVVLGERVFDLEPSEP
jgi:hypothetical protein